MDQADSSTTDISTAVSETSQQQIQSEPEQQKQLQTPATGVQQTQSQIVDINQARELLNQLIKDLYQQDDQIDQIIQAYQNENDIKKNKKNYKKMIADFKKLNDDPAVILEKFLKSVEEVKKTSHECKANQKSYYQLTADKETLIKENEKFSKQNSVLQDILQDLKQRHNKAMEEYNNTVEKQKLLRQDLANSFQTKIQEIQKQVQEQGQVQQQKQQENAEYKARHENIDKQIENRQKIFDAEFQKKQLEFNLQETSLGDNFKMFENSAGDQEKSKQELEKAKELDVKLEEKLNVFLSKSDEFQQVMQLATQHFSQFKQQMDSLGQQIQVLDQQNQALKEQCYKSDINVSEMIIQHDAILQINKVELQKEQNKIDSLISLQKQLQEKLENLKLPNNQDQ